MDKKKEKYAENVAEELRKKLEGYEHVKTDGSNVIIKLNVKYDSREIVLSWRAADWLNEQSMEKDEGGKLPPLPKW
jgi:hypothetical protein